MHMYILPYLISYKRMTEQFFEDKINHHTSNLQVRVCMYARAHTCMRILLCIRAKIRLIYVHSLYVYMCVYIHA